MLHSPVELLLKNKVNTIYCNSSAMTFFIIYFDIVLHNFPWFYIVFIKFFYLICLFQSLKSDKNPFHQRTVLLRNFQHWLLMTSPLLQIRKQKRWCLGKLFQRLIISSSLNIFDRQTFHNFVVTIIWETNILFTFHVFMKYHVLKSS